MTSLIISLLVGGGVGAALGHLGKCSSGTCPLTANWRRGALYGALLGLLFHFASGNGGSPALNKSTPNVQHIGEHQFAAEVDQASMPVVVDFYAVWCGPCKRLSPMLDELAAPLANHVRFVKVNIDESPALAQRFNIQGVPTLLFFRNGKVVDRIVGLLPEAELQARLDALAGTIAASQG